MDVAYLEQSRREYELTRHLSLANVDPSALQTLKATGTCEVLLPETLFDLDCPGHYMRRIKSVSLSAPGVTGPFTPVHCTLTLLSSAVRARPLVAGASADDYGRPDPEDDRFTFAHVPVQTVVTSRGDNDSGLFETNLRDERYLPFEGRGVVESRWRLELPAEFRAFDYDTISDVVLHIRYTAREGGDRLRGAALAAIDAQLRQETEAAAGFVLGRVFALRTESPDEWHKLVHGETQAMALSIHKDRFPYAFQRHGTIELLGADLYFFGTDTVQGDPGTLRFGLSCTAREDAAAEPLPTALLNLALFSDDGRVVHASTSFPEDFLAPTGAWRLAVDTVSSGSAWATAEAPVRLSPSSVKDAYLVVRYRVSLP
jgi:hypothetical protein